MGSCDQGESTSYTTVVVVTFEIARAGYWHWPIKAKIEMRLVHIFEMRDGKISRELVFDMGRPVR
jgi:hypothetical protein